MHAVAGKLFEFEMIKSEFCMDVFKLQKKALVARR